MTRINLGISPAILTGAHLLAEHREMKRIPNMVREGKIGVNNIPDTFRLGTGHVKFFVNKLGYLLDRYNEVYNECLKRGYKVQNYSSAWQGVPKDLMGRYEPTDRDREIVMERLISKDKAYKHEHRTA